MPRGFVSARLNMTRSQNMAKAAPIFKPGDRIAYSVAHLRGTGQTTGPAGAMRGTVQSVSHTVSKSAGVYFTYLPDGETEPRGGLSCNFVLKDRIAIDSALNT
jgi:hypothetical protein